MKKDVTGYRRLVMLSCNKREHDDEDWKKKKNLKKEVFFKGKKFPCNDALATSGTGKLLNNTCIVRVQTCLQCSCIDNWPEDCQAWAAKHRTNTKRLCCPFDDESITSWKPRVRRRKLTPE